MIDHRNALRLFEAWKEILGRDVLKIPSNHEIIRATLKNKSVLNRLC